MFHNKEDLMVGSLQTKAVRTHLMNTNLWAQLQVRYQTITVRTFSFISLPVGLMPFICNVLISQTHKHVWQSLKPRKLAQAVMP